MVVGSGPRHDAVICEDDPDSRRALRAIFARSGYKLVGELDSVAELVSVVARIDPDLIVLDLDLAGFGGLGIIPVLGALAPACAVVLLSSFIDLRFAAIAAGGYDLVDARDLRDLEHCLRRLLAEPPVVPQDPGDQKSLHDTSAGEPGLPR